MLAQQRPKVVVTIHGIRTHGEWQKRLTPHLARHGLVPYHIDYGWFGVLRFLLPFSRARQVQKIREEIRALLEKLRSPQQGLPRISIVAHSFGTYIAMQILEEENGNLRYDRVVLTGSIVRRDFDWQRVLSEKRWTLAVRNERAKSDLVVTFAAWSSRYLHWITWLNAGDSGRFPFTQTAPNLLDSYLGGRHSEVHNEIKFEQWARFIGYPNLPDDLLRKLDVEMQAFRQEAALLLGEPAERVRINLFAPIDGALRMVPGAFENMSYAPEFDLTIQPRHGATGTAYDTARPSVALKGSAGWSGNQLPGEELEKLHPSLKWVVSLPVPSAARKIVVGVLNVDGLDSIPQMLDDPASDECKIALMALHGGMMERFLPILEAAFRGEQLESIEV